MIAISRRAAGRLAMGALAALLAGCGDTAAPTAADTNQARKTLDSALTAWTKGQTVDAVKAASPSILVEDPKWKNGATLKSYEVKGDGRPSGAERVFSVKLVLADASGKETTENVDYRVGTDPILTVFRAMF